MERLSGELERHIERLNGLLDDAYEPYAAGDFDRALSGARTAFHEAEDQGITHLSLEAYGLQGLALWRMGEIAPARRILTDTVAERRSSATVVAPATDYYVLAASR